MGAIKGYANSYKMEKSRQGRRSTPLKYVVAGFNNKVQQEHLYFTFNNGSTTYEVLTMSDKQILDDLYKRIERAKPGETVKMTDREFCVWSRRGYTRGYTSTLVRPFYDPVPAK